MEPAACYSEKLSINLYAEQLQFADNSLEWYSLDLVHDELVEIVMFYDTNRYLELYSPHVKVVYTYIYR